MRRILSIITPVFLTCLTLGCQNKEAMAELEAMKAQAALEEKNKDIVRRQLEAWSQGDLVAFKEFLAPEYAYYSPSRSTNPMFREDVDALAEMLRRAWPDISWSIEELFAEGDRVILRFIVTGTHEGEFQGILPTGSKFQSSGIVIVRIEDEKIVEEKEEFDWLGLYQQLGMELRPKESEKGR